MEICIVSDADSWIKPYVYKLFDELVRLGHSVNLKNKFDSSRCYEVVFLLSYSKIIKEEELRLNKHNIVVHESDLPKGKGWSPLTWQIIEGKNQISITLFEADEKVDNGDIYLQKVLSFNGSELVDELRLAQGTATVDLCCEFLENYNEVIENKRAQCGEETFYRRRRPVDSKLDIDATIRNQFNLLRVVDNEKYPAFFEINGVKYLLKIYKA